MPEDLLAMSAKEVRAGLIRRGVEGRLSQVKAATVMGLSGRPSAAHLPRVREGGKPTAGWDSHRRTGHLNLVPERTFSTLL